MKIKNITLREYSVNPNWEDWHNVLSSLIGKNEFLGKSFDLEEVSYKKVRELESLISKADNYDVISEIFQRAFGCTDEEFLEAGVIDFYYAKNYLFKKIMDIRETESRLLKSVGTDVAKWKQAGGDRLNKYGGILPLTKLGKIYGAFPFELENKPYNQILVLLVYHKEEDEILSNYSKLK